jgi:hypothetical protein
MDHEVHTYKVHSHDSREAEGRDHRTLALAFVEVSCVENITRWHFCFATWKNYANEIQILRQKRGAGQGLDENLSRTAPPIWRAHGRFSSSFFALLGTAGGMTAVQIRLKTRTWYRTRGRIRKNIRFEIQKF